MFNDVDNELFSLTGSWSSIHDRNGCDRCLSPSLQKMRGTYRGVVGWTRPPNELYRRQPYDDAAYSYFAALYSYMTLLMGIIKQGRPFLPFSHCQLAYSTDTV